jgi:shikimate kinase
MGSNDMNIILAGFQGVGKTSCGKLLAAKIDFTFIDTDVLLCDAHGATSARVLYQKVGEKAFREFEGEALQGLQACQNSVIALGGGSLLAPGAEELVPNLGRLLYLYLPLEVLVADCARFCSGAFVSEDRFKEHYLQRHALFDRVCSERIDVENMSFDEIVNKIL